MVSKIWAVHVCRAATTDQPRSLRGAAPLRRCSAALWPRHCCPPPTSLNLHLFSRLLMVMQIASCMVESTPEMAHIGSL